MYGPSSKLGGGRGGGRGGGGMKRLSSSFPPPPAQRPSSAANSSRLSLRPPSSSNPRNRPDGLSNSSSSGAAAASGNAVEETFSLMPGNNPPAFAMIIRLAPDLVEEIRRVEAQGSSARIKFDSGANNTSGNVIDVGGKEFRFTWSRELGDLCDIYEQRQSGEDGNGLLVESGCAWRKVTVQRILDESTKNHVKMLSEEAERKLKSRKAIVLDHQTPSMQNQMKQLQAAESNPWRMPFKQKKDHPNKKRKVEPPQGGGPPKSTLKAVSASNSSVKGRHSLSPLPTTPEQSAAPASPFGAASVTKSHMNPEVVTATQTKSKENTNASEKVIPLRPPGTVGEIPGRKENFGAKPMDLQSMLITLLMENPKGMSLKALEKAVGEMIPNSAEKIEPIIKKIANFQASGRYILKQGVELESFKKPSSESGSSPEDNHRQMLPSEDNLDQRPAPEPRYAGKSPAGQLGEQALSDSKLREDSNAAERIDIEHPSPDLFGEKKGSDNSEGSSSDSGSDSDSESDSSDSGSDSGSHSRSRSRSPVGSGSGSSSDSESDASSNSEGSDVDVDIMTSDDDKEPQHKSQAYEPGFQASPDPWRSPPNGTEEKQDGDGSDAIDIEGNGSAAVDIEGHESDAVNLEKDLADNEKENETAANDLYTPSKEGGDHVEEVKSLSPEHDTIQDRQTYIGNLFEDNENTIQDFAQEQSDSSERISKGKSKRASDMKRCDEKSENAKRFKQNSAQVPIFGGLNGQFLDSSPSRNAEDNYKDPATESMNRANREGNDDFGSEKGYNQTFPGRNSSNFQQSGRRFSDQSGRAKVPDTTGLSKHTESSGHGRKSSEKGSHMHEAFPFQREKPSRDMQNEDSFGKEKKLARNTKDVDVVGRHSGHSETHYRKRGEIFGKSKDTTQLSISHTGSSPIDSNRADMDRHPAISGRSLQRELSDLELGELRESLPEETPAKRQFERKGSFKLLENKQNASDNGNSDLSKGKPTGKAASNSGKPSSPGGVEHNVEDLTRSRPKAGLPHQQHFSRDNAENGNQFSKSVDASIRQRHKEIGTKIGNSMEGYGESHKKAPAGAQQQHEPKRGQLSHSIKETKTQMYNTGTDLSNGQKDTMLSEGNNAQKRRESSSEDDSFPFAKYEKDAPELKGPIKDFSQYKEYAQEYRDKYDSYCSLNGILESYRNEFQQLGKDLEFSKGKDMERYQKVVQQLKESYRLCGARHKRHKKVFIVLHEELKHLKQRIIDYARTVQL